MFVLIHLNQCGETAESIVDGFQKVQRFILNHCPRRSGSVSTLHAFKESMRVLMPWNFSLKNSDQKSGSIATIDIDWYGCKSLLWFTRIIIAVFKLLIEIFAFNQSNEPNQGFWSRKPSDVPSEDDAILPRFSSARWRCLQNRWSYHLKYRETPMAGVNTQWLAVIITIGWLV